jgi:probable rRNA maturation factor
MPVELQLAIQDCADVPGEDEVDQWVLAVFSSIQRSPQEVTIRVVDEMEMIGLNQRYRGRASPTNVLAFPFEPVEGLESDHLGDIAICMPVVKIESKQQDKPVAMHFAHMVIHGTLHLCGYDHQHDKEASVMEALEKTILSEISTQ